MNYIASNLNGFERSLRTRCNDNQLRLQNIVSGYDRSLQGSQLRKSAKRIVEELIADAQQKSQRPADTVREQLCSVFAGSAWNLYRDEFMQLFGPMV
jgi:hypothetical protein